GQGIVAILARVIEAAALHLDSHNVQYLVVMNAASLRIQINSVHEGMEFGHAYKVDEERGKRRADDWQSQFRRVESRSGKQNGQPSFGRRRGRRGTCFTRSKSRA